MHAAIKVGGRRLYELAHRGEVVDRAPRRVTIHALELLLWEPPVATLLVDCSKGTYVRALARDLGAAVGTGAYLSDLVRLRVGPFTLCEAVTLDELAAADLPWAWPELASHRRCCSTRRRAHAGGRATRSRPRWRAERSGSTTKPVRGLASARRTRWRVSGAP
jgi:tRNA U55 pseudouridine synthase TruB